jgi:hypothetical protein
MSQEYFVGVPEGLEKEIAKYIFDSGTNITSEEIRKSVKGFVPEKGFTMKLFDEEIVQEPSNNLYVFFDKEKQNDTIQIHINRQYKFIIPLEREKYGFSSEQKVKINPSRLELDLSKSANKVYELILNSREMCVAELFENVGYIINHSMLYDFTKVFMPGEEKGSGASKWDEVIKEYQPNGEEVISGICVDAGRLIRQILGSLNMENNIGYTAVTSSNNFASHDTTVVFNKMHGNWAVINSKSTLKNYNLAPKEKLVDLGEPYVK